MLRRQLLLYGVAAAGGLMIPSAASLEQLRATTWNLRQAMATGSQSAQLPRLREHVAAITDLVVDARTSRDRVAAQLALAEASVLHASAAEDAGQLQEAHTAAAAVTTAARAAKEPDLAAVGWVKLAVLKLDHAQDPQAAIRCAQYAQQDAITSSMKANGAAWEAIGHAAAGGPGHQGDAYRALGAIERAETHIDKDEHSPWKWVSPALIRKHGGVVHTRLGRYVEGEQFLQEALLKIAADDHKQLWLLMDLIETYVAMDEPEAAAMVGLEVFRGAVERRSRAKLTRLREVTEPLAKWITEPRVYELERALQSV